MHVFTMSVFVSLFMIFYSIQGWYSQGKSVGICIFHPMSGNLVGMSGNFSVLSGNRFFILSFLNMLIFLLHAITYPIFLYCQPFWAIFTHPSPSLPPCQPFCMGEMAFLNSKSIFYCPPPPPISV